MAGLGESCTHVAAVLFFCEHMSRRRSATSVTDVPAYWVNPNSKKKVQVSPKKVVDICYRNVKKMYENPSRKTIDKKIVKINRKYLPAPINNRAQLGIFLNKIQTTNPNCALLRVVQPFCDRKDSKKEFPFLLINLHKVENEKKTLNELQSMASKLIFNLTADDIAFIESQSKLQSRSKIWHLFRVG